MFIEIYSRNKMVFVVNVEYLACVFLEKFETIG